MAEHKLLGEWSRVAGLSSQGAPTPQVKQVSERRPCSRGCSMWAPGGLAPHPRWVSLVTGVTDDTVFPLGQRQGWAGSPVPCQSRVGWALQQGPGPLCVLGSGVLNASYFSAVSGP